MITKTDRKNEQHYQENNKEDGVVYNLLEAFTTDRKAKKTTNPYG